MKEFEFSKLNGQGNDFILLDGTRQRFRLSRKDVSFLCNRNFGIGADGLIIAENSDIADFKMVYFNQDGSSAEMCGNGIRCLARFLIEKSITHKKDLKIETRAGVKEIRYITKDQGTKDISVNMGKPIFNAKDIPADVSYHSPGMITDYEISVGKNIFKANILSMGNPHCVIFTEKDLLDIPLEKWGPEIETHDIFPNKTNVEFIKALSDKKIEMRVWERGVGETLACGTGACASAVAYLARQKILDGTIDVKLAGGDLNIRWDMESKDVYLKGEVEYVYDGRFVNR